MNIEGNALGNKIQNANKSSGATQNYKEGGGNNNRLNFFGIIIVFLSFILGATYVLLPQNQKTFLSEILLQFIKNILPKMLK